MAVLLEPREYGVAGASDRRALGRIIITEVFKKKTKKTPPEVITMSRKRLKAYDDLTLHEVQGLPT